MTISISTQPPATPEENWGQKWKQQLLESPQVFSGLPREAYDELPAYNYSFLKLLWQYCPFRAWQEYRDPCRTQRKEQKHFVHGNLHHVGLLEPGELSNRYAVVPDDAPKRPTPEQLERLAAVDLGNTVTIPDDAPKRPTAAQLSKPRPKEGTAAFDTWADIFARQAWWHAFERENPGKAQISVKERTELDEIAAASSFWNEFDLASSGKELISQSDFDFGAALVGAVLDHPRYTSVFANTSENLRCNELTLTYVHPSLGVRIKTRLDLLRVFTHPFPRLWIGDLKGTKDARPGQSGFGKEVANLGYLMQAAFYHDALYFCKDAVGSLLGLPLEDVADLPIEFEFVAVEKANPRPEYVSGHTISEETHPRELALGRRAALEVLKTAIACDESGWWPGYDIAPQPLEVPEWHMRQIETRLQMLEDE